MPILHLKVRDRQGIILETDVKYLSSFNEKGRFDVLPNHANFISLVDKKILYTPQDEKEEKMMEVKNGVMRVHENKIEIFLSFKGLSDLIKEE